MNKSRYVLLFSFVLFLVGSSFIFLYFFWLKFLIISLYKDDSPLWFKHLIDLLYPRFLVEKERFNLDFFLQKAEQVILRFWLVSTVFSAFLFANFYFSPFRAGIQNFWQLKTSFENVRILRKIYALLMLYLIWDWGGVFWQLYEARAFYQAVFLLKILQLPFFPPFVFTILYLLLVFSLILLFLNIKAVFSSAMAGFLFLLLQGYLFSFYKLDHTFATFTYPAILMPFLLYENQKAWQKGNLFYETWVLQLIRLSIASAYLMAGIEKISIGGLDWFAASNLQSHLRIHPTNLGLWLMQYEWLCVFLSCLSVLFELSFIGILFFTKYTYLFLMAGFLFHLHIYLFLSIGWYIHPWVLVYFFFVDWQALMRN